MIIKYTQVTLILVIVLILFIALEAFLGKKNGEWLYTDAYKNCEYQSEPLEYGGVMIQLYWLVMSFRWCFTHVIILLQIQEWFSSIFLIKS